MIARRRSCQPSSVSSLIHWIRRSSFENRPHDALFSLQEQLYDTGARNFLFFDVPTIHRCPAGKLVRILGKLSNLPHILCLSVPLERQGKMQTTFESWNMSLYEAIERFCAAHDDVSVFLFSAFKAFDSLLDRPETFGLKAEDVRQFNGTVWFDHIHPTSQVHDFIANHVAIFLTGIPTHMYSSWQWCCTYFSTIINHTCHRQPSVTADHKK